MLPARDRRGGTPLPSLYVPDGPCIFPPITLPKEPSLGERHLSQKNRIKLAKRGDSFLLWALLSLSQVLQSTPACWNPYGLELEEHGEVFP